MTSTLDRVGAGFTATPGRAPRAGALRARRRLPGAATSRRPRSERRGGGPAVPSRPVPLNRRAGLAVRHAVRSRHPEEPAVPCPRRGPPRAVRRPVSRRPAYRPPVLRARPDRTLRAGLTAPLPPSTGATRTQPRNEGAAPT